MSDGSTNNSSPSETSNGADRRTIAIVAGIALVAVLAVAALAIAASAGSSNDVAQGVDSSLVGRVWKWLEFASPSGEKIVVDDPNKYTIEFTSDGTVRVLADCNSGSGTYAADGGSISIEVQAMTLAFCEPGSLSDQYVQWLNQVAVYRAEGEGLLMDLPADAGTMLFSSKVLEEQPKTDPRLLGRTWKWYQFTSPTSQVLVDDPNKYTVEFKPDGLVSVKADCNNGGGIYSANEGRMNVEVNHMTMAACPPDSLSDPFVQGLNTVVVYSFDGDILIMDFPADGGTMLLSENPPATQPPTDPNLIGKVWKWYQFQSPVGERLLVPDPNQYSVEFMADGRVHVQADCNTGNGVYTADGSSINIEVQAMTLAMCSPGSFSDQFVQGLNTAAIYFFQGMELYMDLPMDSGTMALSETPPAPQPPQGDPNLLGTWNWTEFTSPAGEKIIVPAPTQYTVEFMADGMVNVKADCNNGNGVYTADGSNINVQINALTRALCSPGSYSEQYVEALNNAALYFFQNGSLFMDLPMDSGTMTFVPVQ